MPAATYLGIPFARADRWSPPAVLPWDGTAPGTPGPIAPQAPGAQFQRADLPQSEDCLSLNVWTPAADDGARPVMVWIHGGAFRQGSNASPLYRGETLATRGDVVVVSINYRLGALGFLAHPDIATDGVSANWGLLDQIAALEWVRDNIAALGGDPTDVTVFGESAGAASVLMLCAAPAARGLFHKAVAQSGAPLVSSAEAAAKLAEELAREVGVDRVARLRDVEASAIVAAQAKLDDPRRVRTFTPCVDGVVLDRDPTAAIGAGSAAGIPMIIGTNVDEWKLWAPADPHSRDLDDERLRRRVERNLPGRSESVITAVRDARAARGELTNANDLWFAIETERFFRVPALRCADAHAQHGPTYVYLFGWGSPAMRGWLGACHGLEIAFVFGNQGRDELAAFTGSGPDADALAERMMDAWLAFARTGDPSTPDLPWPRHDPATRPTVVFDAHTRLEHAPRDAERAAIAGSTA
jgi:para-nitrobenzyl esterase